MRFSIIIPVYNVEDYIGKCLDSILAQTYKNYEIIVVDDGSNDKSGFICDEYASKYSNIKVIHKENGGASSARNVGIKAACGEYIIFVDSDDFFYDEHCLESLTCDADVIQYKMDYFYEKQEKFVFMKNIPFIENISFSDQLSNLINSGNLSISPCDKAVKREIIVNNDIYFDENLVAEDIDWSLRLYFCVNSIEIINKDFYVYRQQREGSVSSKFKEKNITSLYYIIDYWYNYKYLDEKIKENYLNYLSYQYLILISSINKNNCDKELKRKIYKLKSILNYSDNFKVRMSNKAIKLFGFTIGVSILKIYIFLKNKGLVKI